MITALLTAAGSGSRMGQDIPKQFIHIDNKPLIIHTMEAFQRHPSIDAILVVTLPSWIDVLKAYASQFNITKLRWVDQASLGSARRRHRTRIDSPGIGNSGKRAIPGGYCNDSRWQPLPGLQRNYFQLSGHLSKIRQRSGRYSLCGGCHAKPRWNFLHRIHSKGGTAAHSDASRLLSGQTFVGTSGSPEAGDHRNCRHLCTDAEAGGNHLFFQRFRGKSENYHP